MGYLRGERLQERVQALGLEGLREVLEGVADGQPWTGPLLITPQSPAQAEQVRMAIYSLLHQLGLKPRFQVRLIQGTLTLDQRHPGPVGISRLGPAPGLEPDEAEPLGDEGLISLIREEENG